MQFYSELANECLFCGVVCEPPPSDSPGGGEESWNCSCQQLSDNPLLGTSPEQNETEPKSGLEYAFILSKLLDYPKSKCIEYLQSHKCNDRARHTNQDRGGGWFSVCTKCSKLVEEGHSIHHRIEALEEKLGDLKENLKAKISTSYEEEKRPLPSRGDPKNDSICLEVRNYVKQKSFDPATSTPVSLHNVKEEVDDWDDDCETADGFHEDNSRTSNFGDEFVDESEEKSKVGQDGQEAESGGENSDHSEDGEASSTPKRKPRRSKRKQASFDSTDDDQCGSDAEWTPDVKQSTKSKRSTKTRKRLRSDSSPESDDASLSEKTPPQSCEEDEDTASEKVATSGRKDLYKYKCKICFALYKTKHRLMEHEELHEPNSGSFQCPVCPFVSKTSRSAATHQKKMHSSKSKSTNAAPNKGPRLCPKPSKTKSTEKVLYQCSECPYVYKTEHRLREHEQLHERDDVISCKKCSYVCLYDRSIKIHMTKFHKGGSEEEVEDVDVDPDPDPEVSKSGADTTETATCADEGSSESEDTSPETESLSKEKYRCKICKITYTSKYRLQYHKNLHKDPSAVKCKHCSFVCRTKRHLIMHLKKVHEDKIPLNKSHSSKSGAKANKRRIRPAQGPFQCDHCSLVYENLYRLKYHVKDIHPDKLLKCDKCERCFESKQLHDHHVTTCNGHASDSEHEASADKTEDVDSSSKNKKKFACEHCPLTFISFKRCSKHVATVHSKNTFRCTVCSASFPTESRLRYHKARAHPLQHNICTVCGYKSHGASHLRLHMQKHTKQRMSMCEICSRTFATPSNLTAHKQKEHMEEFGLKPIKCDECDMLFGSKAHLKYHIQKVHERKFKYFCETCGKGYLFASSLENHAVIHSSDRNHICQLCGASYRQVEVLKKHIKQHHPETYAVMYGTDPSKSVPAPTDLSNEGPFTCKFCSKEFPMRWTLHHHLQTHTEVYEKYKCDKCDKGYASQAGLKRHEETAHDEGTYSCSFCKKTFPCRDYLRSHIRKFCQKKKETDANSSTSADRTEASV